MEELSSVDHLALVEVVPRWGGLAPYTEYK